MCVVLARSEPVVRQAVRPHVLRPPQPSVGERALHGYLKRMEVAVAVVTFLVELAKGGDGTHAVGEIHELAFATVEPNGGEQLMPLAALVSNLADKVTREHPLDGEIPVFEVSVLGDSDPTPWASINGAGSRDGSKRPREAWHIR